MFETETIGDVGVLRIKDDDAWRFENLPDTSRYIDDFLAGDQKKLVIDLCQTECYDSMVLGLIVSKRTKAEAQGKQLKYCNINPRTMWSIQATRVHTLLDICMDVEQACAEHADEG